MVYRIREGATLVAKRSLHRVREHDNGPRTQPVGFFNRLLTGNELSSFAQKRQEEMGEFVANA